MSPSPSWPYHLVDLTNHEKHLRRKALDRYGIYAQLSILIPILPFLLYRLGSYLLSKLGKGREREYDVLPSSPQRKAGRGRNQGRVGTFVRRVEWWLDGEVGGWGKRKFWVVGGLWGMWMGGLCVWETGDDYLHITKRFGVIAASQFPLHYMLSMKSTYSPLALIFSVSHEELNPYHRLSGRIIYLLLCLHASWYMNFFVQAGLLKKRLVAPVVIIGILVFLALTTIVTTALAPVRRWSYRVFFVIHLVLGITILPMLFFHAGPLRIYMIESLLLFVFDIVCRKLDTVTGYATITPVPNTDLLQVRIPIPESKLKRFHAAPGQHVYLSIPPSSTPTTTSTPSIHGVLFNPFTISSVSSNDITLVLRSQNGPTTNALNTLANMPKAKPPLNIEGPLGSSKFFPDDLAKNCDRILLIAGGVGATFILPLYAHFQEAMESVAKSPDRVSLVWSIKTPSEAAWARDVLHDDDESAQVYVTGSSSSSLEQTAVPSSSRQDVELTDLNRDKESGEVRVRGGYERPDFEKIVNAVFRLGGEERVAVLVCGPEGMARDVRRVVGRWVEKGRDVWWHDEGFGW
ncbi:hypothetical protein HYFRA_00003118 [Hymenoscyphus fraxineus]|uniref:ferric-chelate reductase (NADPH) n=1 Tax=Hymenoscyphus fraxineus TaxID=746836 RepID=A0A9N9PLA7_9HELO|nr:hypothetical protein HYFRA_00003118 [Hymenoscyphus fraxineus]